MEVTVGTGVAAATWNIPKALLSHHSAYFHIACHGKFKEALENKVKLADCDPKLFQHFVQWIYFATTPGDLGSEDEIWDAFRLWALGDRLMATGFKNHMMKIVHEAHDWEDPYSCDFELEEVVWCAKNTTQDSQLRKWLIDTLALHWIHCDYIEEYKEVWVGALSEYADLLTALLCKMAGMRKDEDDDPETEPVAAYLEK